MPLYLFEILNVCRLALVSVSPLHFDESLFALNPALAVLIHFEVLEPLGNVAEF